MDEKKQSIEDLAWKMYQSGVKLKWETKVTPREEFSKHENYDDYMNAVKQSLHRGCIPQFETSITYKLPSDKKTYPIIKVPANGHPGWYGGARTWCFVYSKDHGNFILEGFLGEVKEYLKKNYTHYFCYYSMWSQSRSRGYWRFWKEHNVNIIAPSKFCKERKYIIEKREVKPFNNGRINYGNIKTTTFLMKLKRMPKRWIKEFNQL